MASSLMLLLLLKTICCSYDLLKGMDISGNVDQTTTPEDAMDVDTSKEIPSSCLLLLLLYFISNQLIWNSFLNVDPSQPTRRRGRGTTRLAGILTQQGQVQRREVGFDAKGRPMGKEGDQFISFLGLKARSKVRLLHSWRTH